MSSIFSLAKNNKHTNNIKATYTTTSTCLKKGSSCEQKYGENNPCCIEDTLSCWNKKCTQCRSPGMECDASYQIPCCGAGGNLNCVNGICKKPLPTFSPKDMGLPVKDLCSDKPINCEDFTSEDQCGKLKVINNRGWFNEQNMCYCSPIYKEPFKLHVSWCGKSRFSN